MKEKVTLSANQKKALAALLTEKTVRDAAAVVGISEKTVYQYLNNPVFRDALNSAQDELMREAVNRLIGGLNTALKALDDLIAGSDDTNKRLAAIAWLTHALKLKEFSDLENRIANLESKLQESEI